MVPFHTAARQAQLTVAEEQLDREAYQKLDEASADLTERGLWAVGHHPVCTEVVRMAGQLVDAALEFEGEAKEYELKRLQVQGSCDNPFSEAREVESFEFIARKIDGTAAWIRSMPIGKRLWHGFDQQSWDDLRRIEKSSVERRLRLEYQKRRAAFDLELQAASAAGDELPDEYFRDEDGTWLTASILKERFDIPDSRLKVWREERCHDLDGKRLAGKKISGIGWVYARIHVNQIANRRDDRAKIEDKLTIEARLDAANKLKREKHSGSKRENPR